MNAAGPNYPTASLYVGDLHPEVTEVMLFEQFLTAGPIVSIRVCRDIASKRSLGFAYVNFLQPADAERALDTMNFYVIMGKPMRIMWSQRDPNLWRSGFGNVFIKNLDIDNKAVYDTFSAFGNILSCKVATDENGENRGYGFVQFETEESALKAVKNVNGMLLNGRKIFVGKFIPQHEQSSSTGDHARKYTNVYIKNIGEELGEEDLQTICESYGKVLSLKIMSDMEGNSRGFGFVSFESHDAANMCVEDMNGKEQSGRQLFAGPAQKRSERSAEFRARLEAIRQERNNRFQGVNLYIKNLDDDIDDDRLTKEFARFGNIFSAKVMKNDNEVSRGFGFVCFSSEEEATKAVTEMNNRIISVKPLYVALAQRKEVRQAQLAIQYMRLNMTYRVPGQPMSQIYPGGFNYNQTVPQRNLYAGQKSQDTHEIPQQAVHVPGQAPLTAQMLAQAQPHEQKQMLGERLFSIIQQSHRDFAGKITGILLEMDNAELLHMLESDESLKAKISEALSVLAVNQQKEQKKIAGLPNAQAMRMDGATATQRPTYKFPQGPSGNKAASSAEGQPMSQIYPGGFNYNQIVPERNLYAGQIPQDTHEIPQQAVHVPGQAPLTAQMLAQAQPHEQKQKITGILLEMDNAELLHMLESDESLKAKISEALSVLAVNQQKEQKKIAGLPNAQAMRMGGATATQRPTYKFPQGPSGNKAASSAEVMKNDKEVSRGFDFVCFSSQEEATKAVNEMNDRIISVKPLYVALVEHKEVPQAQLATQNMNYRVPASYASVKAEETLLEECETPDVSQESILAADYGRLMVNVADDLTLDSTLKLAILFGLPPAEIDMIRRVSLIETPGLTLIKFMKTRNIINMYDVTNLQKGLVYIKLNQTNENHLAPYQSKVDPFQFEENQSPELLDWPGKNEWKDAIRIYKTKIVQ